MSKVICDVCGTSYPETAAQCPICGCARPAESTTVADEQRQSSGYTYVKGGRFSKSNVRKRMQGNELTAVSNEKKPSNKKALGLIIVLVCLILIVAFMILYVLNGWSRRTQPDTNIQSTTDTTEQQDIACTGLSLSQLEITMGAAGEVWILEATPAPSNTTDAISYSSSNEAVATVSSSGKITCVDQGQAVITVTCGEITAECKVSCVFEIATEPPTVAPEGIRLNRKSITADYEGFSWTLYDGEVSHDQIVWTSDDPTVATVTDGVVIAVSEGQTEIHAEYDGVITSCTIICDFEEPTMPEENGEEPGENSETTAPAGNGDYLLYNQFGDKIPFDEYEKIYDVTLSVGSSVGLYLTDSSGNTLELTWTVVEGSSCEVDGNYVSVQSSETNCLVQTEYEGVTYSCLIRTVN